MKKITEQEKQNRLVEHYASSLVLCDSCLTDIYANSYFSHLVRCDLFFQVKVSGNFN